MSVPIGLLPWLASAAVVLAWWLVVGVWGAFERHWIERLKTLPEEDAESASDP